MIPLSHPLRLAEAAGVLSLATDLAMGQPLEHGLRTAVLAVRIAQAMGLSEDDQVTVFYTGLLHFAGCTAESEIDARFFGDELVARPQMMAAYQGSRRELVAAAMRVAHPGSAPLARAAMMARSVVGGVAEFRKWAASHCDVARLLGARMGFSEQVQQALRHLYERWDGKGMPGDIRGTQIPLAVRLMQVAQDADMAWQQGGAALAGRMLSEHAGAGLDPQAVAAFLSLGDDVYEGLGAPSIWENAMLAEPGPQQMVSDERLDACLSAIADFADLKSMWTVGHSRGVAQLAEESAVVARAPCRRGAAAAPGGAGARHRPRRCARQRVGQAGSADPRRARAGAAARLSQRAGARRRCRAAPAGPAGRIAWRGLGWVRLPPGQSGW